jgi:hypothetical protein
MPSISFRPKWWESSCQSSEAFSKKRAGVMTQSVPLPRWGLRTLLLQTFAGVVTNRVASRRLLFAVAGALTGVCFALIPFCRNHELWINVMLFASGTVQSFFPPLLSALALALVGHELVNGIAGVNQGWNHAGNIAAAVAAILLVRVFGMCLATMLFTARSRFDACLYGAFF